MDEAVVVDEAFTQKGCPLHKEDDDAKNELDDMLFNRSCSRRQLTMIDETDEEDYEETIEETSVAPTPNPGASKPGPQTSGKRPKQYRWDAGNKRAYLLMDLYCQKDPKLFFHRTSGITWSGLASEVCSILSHLNISI